MLMIKFISLSTSDTPRRVVSIKGAIRDCNFWVYKFRDPLETAFGQLIFIDSGVECLVLISGKLNESDMGR